VNHDYRNNYYNKWDLFPNGCFSITQHNLNGPESALQVKLEGKKFDLEIYCEPGTVKVHYDLTQQEVDKLKEIIKFLNNLPDNSDN